MNLKKKLFSIVIFLFFTNNVLANTYWSNVKDGPYSAENAITEKLSGRMLDPIEGIWFDDGLGTTVIFKDKNIYKLYIIDIGYDDDKVFNRTWEATFVKRDAFSYNFFTRVWYQQLDGSYKTKTQAGKTSNIFTSSNEIFMDYNNLSDHGIQMDHSMTRVWPTNLADYNSQFVKKDEQKKEEPKQEASNQEKPKKKYDPYITKTNYKNYWWVVIILALGAFFLYTKTVPKPKKVKRIVKNKPTGFKKDLINYWQGKVSYGFSYWVCLTIIGTIISLPVLYFFTDQFIDSASEIVLLMLILYALFVIVSQIYLIVGTWRSAEFYKAQKRKLKQSLIWGYLGQISIVLSIIRKVAEFI